MNTMQNNQTKGRLNMTDCIQGDMKCSCTAKTPKGVSYHPSLKAVYERVGAKGHWTKVGLRCPKCGHYQDLDGGK